MLSIRASKDEPGFILSAVVHVTLLVVGMLGFADAKPFEDAQESISVEMISDNELKQITQGEKTAKQVLPDAKLRVDKVAPQQKQDDPGEKKQDIAAPQPAPSLPPVKPVEIAKSEPQKTEPKAGAPVATPPTPAPALPPVRPTELAKTEVKKVALAQPSQNDEPDPEAEIIRQAAKKAPIPRKEDAPEVKAKADAAAKDAAAKLAEQQKAEEQKRVEEQKQAELKKIAEAKAAAQAAADAAADAKTDAEQKAKADEQAKAEARMKADAEAKKKAVAAAKAAADAEAKRQAEFNKALRAKLASASTTNGGNGQQLPSDRVASATGSTGAQINRNPSSLGAPNASGAKLNPSERAGLSEAVALQVSQKLSYTGTMPKVLPIFIIQIGRDGSLLSQPQLVNSSDEPTFQAMAAAGARAIRLAAPFHIDARYSSAYEEWSHMRIRINPGI